VLARDYDGTIAPDGKVDNKTARRTRPDFQSSARALQSNRSGNHGF
jgi:hypothetical protein